MANPLRRAELKHNLFWGALILLIGGSALWYVGTTFEWVEEEVRVGASGEARTNPYYAAQLLSERLGFTVTQVADARELMTLPPRATLFLPSPQAFDEEQVRRMLDWIENGGRIVLPASGGGPLVDKLGVRVAGWRSQRGGKDTRVQVSLREHKLELDVGNFVQLLGSDRVAVDRVRVAGGEVSWHDEHADPDAEDGDCPQEDDEGDCDNANDPDDGKIDLVEIPADRTGATIVEARSPDILLHVRVGEGAAVVLADTMLFGNRRIADADHAEYLVRVLMLPGVPESIVFAPDPVFPSLLAWLVQHAWMTLIAGVALLLAWLWRAAPRFGPLTKPPAPMRPGLLEHLRAVGEFHLKERNYAALLAPLREECARQLRLHAVREGSAAQLVLLAQRLSGLPESEVRHAFGGNAADRGEFLRLAGALARIRAALVSDR